MRIAIDIRKIGKKSTGDEVVFYHLVKELAKLKESQKHKFLLLTDQNITKISNILGKLPSNFEIHQVVPTAKLFWTFYSLPRFLRKNPVDVLHVEYIPPFHLSRRIKIVTTIHDVSFRANPEWIKKKDSLLLNNFIPIGLKRVNAVITVSEFSKREIVKFYNYPKEKIFVTHPAIDRRIFDPQVKLASKGAIQKLTGSKDPYLLHISSLQPRKNVPLIVRAHARLLADWREEDSVWKNTKLVLVGNKKGYNYDKGIDEEVSKQIQNNQISEKDVISTGYLSTDLLPAIYRNALVFVFPSSYEGFGIPLLEAMSCKTPVVASNIGSFKEVGAGAATLVEIAGRDGKKRLAEAIKNLVENKKLRQEQIKAGLERIKLFDWGQLARKTLEVYENII